MYYEDLTLEQKIAHLELELELLRFNFRLPIHEVWRRKNLLVSEIGRLESILRQQRWEQGVSEVAEWAAKQGRQTAICDAAPQNKRWQAELAFDINGIIDAFASPPQTLAGQILSAGSIAGSISKYLYRIMQQATGRTNPQQYSAHYD